MIFKPLATALLASLLLSAPGHANDQNAIPAEDLVTTDDLVNQFQFLLEQVQRHPEVKRFTESMSNDEWRTTLSKLIEDYSANFSHLEPQLRTLREQAGQVFAEGTPYEDPIGNARNAVKALEERMREQKEQIDNL